MGRRHQEAATVECSSRGTSEQDGSHDLGARQAVRQGLCERETGLTGARRVEGRSIFTG